MWYIQIIYYAMHDKISSMKKINEPKYYLMDSLNIIIDWKLISKKLIRLIIYSHFKQI